ncbi:unnamed protein product [Phyllotreta striolata]|uniref:Uncharacterized protein n=1 Tax=Phyllotreta striolata TaxID=444603 RepID=A0A9N9TF20_PHYSR|nr:unnamed protein product [Phyllotreta striolata]
MKLVFGEISFILLYVLSKFAIHGEPLERNHRFVNWRGLRPKCRWNPPQETQCENIKPVALIIKEFLHIEYYSLLCTGVNIGNNTVAVPTECFEWDGKAVDEHFITSGSQSWCNGPVKHRILDSKQVLQQGVGMSFLHVDPPMPPPCEPFRTDSSGSPTSMIGFNVTDRDGYNMLSNVDCESDVPTGALYNPDGSFYGFQHPRCSFSNEHKPIKYEGFHKEYNRPPVEVKNVQKDPEELLKELNLNFELPNNNDNSPNIDEDVLVKLDNCARSVVRNEVRLDDVVRQNTRLVEKSIQLEQRVSTLENLVKALTNSNDDGNGQLKNDIVEELVELKKANQNCDNKIESVSSECKNILKVMQEELQRYDDKSSQTKSLVDDMQDKQSKANNNVRQIQKDISQLKTDIEKCKANNLNTTIPTVEYTTVPTIGEYTSSTDTSSTELSIRNNYNSYTGEKLAAEIDYIHTKLEDLNEMIVVNKLNVDGTKTKTQDLEAQLKEIQKNLQTSGPQLADDDRIEDIISDNKQLQNQIDNIHNKLKDINDYIGNKTIQSKEVPEISLDDLKIIENKLEMTEKEIKKEIEQNKNNTDLKIDHLGSTIKDIENSLSDNNPNESFQSNIQAIVDGLQKDVTKNTKQIEELKTFYEPEKINDIFSNMSNFKEKIEKDLALKIANISQRNQKVFEDVEQSINNINSDLKELKDVVDSMKNRSTDTSIHEILTQLNNETNINNASEYDVLFDQIYQNIEQIKKDLLTTTIKLAERNDNQIEKIQKKITHMELELKNSTTDMENIQNKIEQNIFNIQKNTEDIKNIYGKQKEIINDTNEISNTTLNMSNNKDQFEDIYNIINEIQKVINRTNNDDVLKDIQQQVQDIEHEIDNQQSSLENILTIIENLDHQNNITKNEVNEILSKYPAKIHNASNYDDIYHAIDEIQENLETKIGNISQQNEGIQASLRDLQFELSNKIDTIQKEIDNNTFNIKEISKSLQNLHSEYNGTETTEEEIPEFLEEIKKSIMNSEAAMKNCTNEINKLAQDNNKLNDEMQNILKELQNKQVENNFVETINNLTKQIETCTNVSQTNHNAIEDIKKSVNNREFKNENNTTQNLENIINDIQNLYSQNNKSKMTIEDIDTNVNEIIQAINTLESKLTHLSDSNNDTLDDIKKSITNTETTINNLQNEMDENTRDIFNDIRNLYSQNNETKTTLDKIKLNLSNGTDENCNNEDINRVYQAIDEAKNELEYKIANQSEKNKAEIDKIKEEIEDLQLQFGNTTANDNAFEEVLNTINYLKADLDETKNNLTELCSKEDLNKAIEDANNIPAIEEIVKTVKAEIENFSSNITNMQSKIDDNKNRINYIKNELQKNVGNITEEIEGMKNLINNLEADINETKNNLTEMGSKEDLNKAIENAKNISAIEEIIKIVEAEMENFSSNITNMQSEIVDNKNQIKYIKNELQKNVGNITEEIEGMKKTINNVQADIEETKNNLTEMCSKEDLNDIQQAIEEQMKQSEFEEFIKTVEAKIENATSNITNMQNKLDKTEINIKEILSDINNLYLQNNQSKTEIDITKDKIDDLLYKISNISEANNDVLEEVMNTINNVQADIEETKHNLTEMCRKEDLNEVYQTIENSKNISAIEEIVKTVEEKLENYTDNVTNLQNKIDEKIDRAIYELEYKISNITEANKDGFGELKSIINDVKHDINGIKINLTEMCSKDDLNEVYEALEDAKKDYSEVFEEIIRTVDAKIENVTSNITEAQNEIVENKQNIKGIINDIEILYSHNNQSKTEIDETKDKIKNLQHKIENLTEANMNEFKEIMTRMNNIASDIDETKNNVTDICRKDDLKEVYEALNDVKNQSSVEFEEIIKAVKAKIEDLTRNLTDAQNEIDENKIDTKEIQNDIQILNSHNNQTKFEIDETKDQINDLQHKIENLTEANSNKIKEIMKRMNNITSDINETKNNLTDICSKNDLKEVYKALNDAKNQTALEIDEIINTVEAKIEDLTSNLTDAQNEIDENKQDIKDIQNEIEILHSYNNQSKTEIDETKDKIINLKHKIENLTEDNSNEIKNIMKRMNNITSDIDETKNNLTGICSKDDLKEIYKALKDAKNQSSLEFDEIIKTVEAKIDDLTINLTDAQNEIDENKQDIKDIQNEIEILHSYNNQSKTENDETKDKIKNLKHKIENLTEANRDELKKIMTRMNNITTDIEETKNNLTEISSKDDLSKVYQALEDAKNQSSKEFEEIIRTVRAQIENLKNNTTNAQNEIDENKLNIIEILNDIQILYSQSNQSKTEVDQTNNKIDELQNKLGNLSESNSHEIKEIMTRMNNITNDIDETKNYLNDMCSKDDLSEVYEALMNAKNQSLLEFEEIITTVEAKIDNITSNIPNMQNQIDDNKADIISIILDIQNLYSQNNETKIDIDDINNRTRKIDDMINRNDLHEVNQTINEIKNELETISETNNEALEHIIKLFNDSSKHDQSIRDLFSRSVGMVEDIKNLTKKIGDDGVVYQAINEINHELESIVVNMSKINEDTIEDIKNLYSANNNTRTEIGKIINKLDQKINNASEINDYKFNYVHQRLDNITNDLEDKTANLTQQSKALEEIINSIEDEYKSNIQDILKELQNFHDQNNQTKSEFYEDLARKINDSSKDLLQELYSTMEEEKVIFFTELNKTRDDYDNIMYNIEDLYSLSNQTKTEISDAVDDLKTSISNVSLRYINMLEEIKEDAQNTKLQLAYLTDTTQNYATNMSNLEERFNEDIENLDSKFEDLQNRAKQLDEEIEEINKKFYDLEKYSQNTTNVTQGVLRTIDILNSVNNETRHYIENTIDSIRSELNVLRHLVQEIHNDTEQRFKDLESLVSKGTTDLQSKIEGLEGEVEALQYMNSRLSNRLEDETQALQDDVLKVQDDNEAINYLTERLSKGIDELEQTVDDFQSSAEKKLAALEQYHETMESKFKANHEQLTNRVDAFKNDQDQINDELFDEIAANVHDLKTYKTEVKEIIDFLIDPNVKLDENNYVNKNKRHDLQRK